MVQFNSQTPWHQGSVQRSPSAKPTNLQIGSSHRVVNVVTQSKPPPLLNVDSPSLEGRALPLQRSMAKTGIDEPFPGVRLFTLDLEDLENDAQEAQTLAFSSSPSRIEKQQNTLHDTASKVTNTGLPTVISRSGKDRNRLSFSKPLQAPPLELRDEIEKTDKVAQPVVRELNGLPLIGAGKAKEVWGNKGEKYVYITPVATSFHSSIYNPKEEEIRKEVATCADIKHRLGSSGGDHLALELEEVSHPSVGYMVQSVRADGDMEKLLQEEGTSLNFNERINLSYQILDGMNDLHRAGYVHGDSKLENLLFYRADDGQLTVRVSDFGKSRPLPTGEDALHTGNPRFAAPEGRLHQAGEIYSTALMVIRVLEQPFLGSTPGQMLLNPTHTNPDVKPKEGRCGIERFLIMNKDCPQTENNTFKGTFRVVTQNLKFSLVGMASPDKLQDVQSEVHRYIGALMTLLRKEANNPADLAAIDTLETLLLQMTNSDPERRGTLQQVQNALLANATTQT